MRWITRERIKVDRVACPWLIRKFVDADAEFVFLPHDTDWSRVDGIVFDVAGAELGHHGEGVSFDAILDKYRLNDPALRILAEIVRAADAHPRNPHPAGEGLRWIAHGFASLGLPDHEILKHEFIVYDALFAECRKRAAAPAYDTALIRTGSRLRIAARLDVRLEYTGTFTRPCSFGSNLAIDTCASTIASTPCADSPSIASSSRSSCRSALPAEQCVVGFGDDRRDQLHLLAGLGRGVSEQRRGGLGGRAEGDHHAELSAAAHRIRAHRIVDFEHRNTRALPSSFTSADGRDGTGEHHQLGSIGVDGDVKHLLKPLLGCPAILRREHAQQPVIELIGDFQVGRGSL